MWLSRSALRKTWRPTLCVWVLVCFALLARAGVPAGYMPASAGDTLLLTVCYGAHQGNETFSIPLTDANDHAEPAATGEICPPSGWAQVLGLPASEPYGFRAQQLISAPRLLLGLPHAAALITGPPLGPRAPPRHRIEIV